MKKKFKDKLEAKVRAKEGIQHLFAQAESVFRKDPSLSDRYVVLARKLSTKYKVRIPSTLKKRFCKNCSKYLVPSVNCRIRASKGKLVYFCNACKHMMRFPYRSRKE